MAASFKKVVVFIKCSGSTNEERPIGKVRQGVGLGQKNMMRANETRKIFRVTKRDIYWLDGLYLLHQRGN